MRAIDECTCQANWFRLLTDLKGRKAKGQHRAIKRRARGENDVAIGHQSYARLLFLFSTSLCFGSMASIQRYS